jgi:hypothetical protein
MATDVVAWCGRSGRVLQSRRAARLTLSLASKVLDGREGTPRSLGSVLGGAVTRFLGGSVRGVVSRGIDIAGVKSLHSDDES